MTDEDNLMSLGQVAHALGVSVEAVRRRVRSGDLRAVKLGDLSTPAPLRVRPADLRAYVDEHLVTHSGRGI